MSGQYFVKLPDEVLFAKLSAAATVLYAVFVRLAFGNEDGCCYASQEMLAKRLGWSVRRVGRATAELIEAELIEVEYRRGPNKVTPLMPWVPPPPDGRTSTSDVNGDGRTSTSDVRRTSTSGTSDETFTQNGRPRSDKYVRPFLRRGFRDSSLENGRAAQTPSGPTPDDATGAQLRDEHSSKDEEDPLAVRLAATVGAPYDAALKKVAEWRCVGISPLVIDEAIGFAAEDGRGRTLAYVGKIAADWMGQRNPGWRPPVGRIPTFADSGQESWQGSASDPDSDPDSEHTRAVGEVYHLGERDYRDADGFWTGDGCGVTSAPVTGNRRLRRAW